MQYKNLFYKILIIILLLFLYITLFSEENYDTKTNASIKTSVSDSESNNNSSSSDLQSNGNDFNATYDTITNASEKKSTSQSNTQDIDNTDNTTYTTISTNDYDTVTNASEKTEETTDEKLAYNNNNNETTSTSTTTSTTTTSTTTTIYHFVTTTTTTTSTSTSTTIYHFIPTTTTTIYHFIPTTTTTIYHFIPTTTTTIPNNQKLYVYNNKHSYEETTNKTEKEYFNSGRKMLLHGSYDSAIYNFTKAIEQNEKAEYFYYRGISSYANGDIGKAILDTKKSISKDNTNYSTYIFYLYCASKISQKEFEIAKNFLLSEQHNIKQIYGQRIINYFLNKIPLSDILRFDITTNLTREQFICKSYAYAGLVELLDNNIENAKTCFELSIETNEKELDTYYLSKIEYEKILSNE